MASPESQQIRAGLVNDRDSISTPIEQQRREWEAAVETVNQQIDAAITPADLSGLYGEWVQPEEARGQAALLYLHGGGYSAGSCKTHRDLAARLARAARMRVLLVDYRLAPEHAYPAAVEDATQAYQWLLDQGISARQIAIGGDSSGGGLALAALLKLRDSDIALPAAAILLSPWLDLTMSGESISTRAPIDPLCSYEGLRACAELYLQGGEAGDPLASPLFGDLRGLPPTLIHVGDHEVLLSDSVRLAEYAAREGVAVELTIWEEMWHVWHAWAQELPEARDAIAVLGAFLRRHCGAE